MRLKHSNPSGRATSSRRLSRWTALAVTSVAARDETQGMLWQAAEYVLYYGSDVKAGARHAGCGRRRRDQRPA